MMSDKLVSTIELLIQKLETSNRELAALLLRTNRLDNSLLNFYNEIADRHQLGKATNAEMTIANTLLDFMDDADTSEEVYLIVRASDMNWYDLNQEHQELEE
jgi:hypothetical protein